MYCKKCGAALPSRGFICKSCGALMDGDQIKMQKEYMQNEENKKIELNFLSDRYSNNPINREFNKVKENKYLGAVLIIIILMVIIIFAILKVM